MEHEEIGEEGGAQQEGQSRNGSRSSHDARGSDAILSHNEGVRNDDEGNPSTHDQGAILHPQNEEHQIEGSKHGRRHSKSYEGEESLRHEKHHSRIQRQVIHAIVYKVVRKTLLKMRRFRNVEKLKAFRERNLRNHCAQVIAANFPQPHVFTLSHNPRITTLQRRLFPSTRIVLVLRNQISNHSTVVWQSMEKKQPHQSLLLNNTFEALRSSALVRRVSRQRQEVAVRRIRSHHVQIEVLELVSRVHLPHAVVRHLHEQLLRPRLVVRRVVLLLARQRTLVVLYASRPPHSTTQPRLLRLHRLPVRSLGTADRLRHLVPQTTRLVRTLVRHVQHLLRQHRQLRHVQEERLLPMIINELPYVLLVGVGQVVLTVPVSVEVVEHLPVVGDHRRHAVQLAAEHRLRLTPPPHAHLAVELDLRLVARLLALQHQFVDQLHAQRPEEQTRARERGDDRVVLR